MAFVAQAGAGGGIPRPRTPVNPYPHPRPTLPALPPQPTWTPPTYNPPTFQTPPPIDTSSFGAQAAAEVSRQIDPILQLIAQRNNAQAAYTQQSVSALTGAYANRLQGLAEDASNIYKPEIASSKALGAASQKYMTDAGTGAAATEASATGLQGLSAGSDVPLAAEGAGSGNAAEIIQAGMTEALKGAQAAATKYAGALPGFARTQGDQTINQALQQLAATMANQLADVTAQAPALYHTLYNELQDRAESDRAFKLELAKLAYTTQSDAYDRELAAKKLTYETQSDAYDRAVAARKVAAGIVGPKAPTAQGRLAYFTGLAADRTKADPEGRQWFATDRGINFRKGPGGEALHTKEWVDRQAEIIVKTHSTSGGAITPEGQALLKKIHASSYVGSGGDPAITLKITIQKIKSREAALKLSSQQTIAANKLTEQIAHNRVTEANASASIQQRTNAANARVAATKRLGFIKAAAARTKATGNVYIAGPNGIMLVRTPDGKPVRAGTPNVTTTTTTTKTKSGSTTTTQTTANRGSGPRTAPPPAPPAGSGNSLGPGANTGSGANTGAAVRTPPKKGKKKRARRLTNPLPALDRA